MKSNSVFPMDLSNMRSDIEALRDEMVPFAFPRMCDICVGVIPHLISSRILMSPGLSLPRVSMSMYL